MDTSVEVKARSIAEISKDLEAFERCVVIETGRLASANIEVERLTACLRINTEHRDALRREMAEALRAAGVESEAIGGETVSWLGGEKRYEPTELVKATDEKGNLIPLRNATSPADPPGLAEFLKLEGAVRWEGGECPVGDDVLVEAFLRNGTVLQGQAPDVPPCHDFH